MPTMDARIGGAKTLLTETGLMRPILEEWDEEVRTKGELKSDKLVLFERNYTQVDLKSSNPIAEESRLESIQVTISLCSLYVKESAIKAKTVQTQQCQSSSFRKLQDNMEKLVAGFSMVLARMKPDQTSSSDVQWKAGNASEQVVKIPCLLRTRPCTSAHHNDMFLSSVSCVLIFICAKHLVARSHNLPFVPSLHPWFLIPIVDLILSDCHWLRCLAGISTRCNVDPEKGLASASCTTAIQLRDSEGLHTTTRTGTLAVRVRRTCSAHSVHGL